jgi:DNA replication and repair protein RecF
MIIKNIQVKNFRNYPELNLQISNKTVVFSGPNAVGKTNLLESVYFGSLFKSFRDDTEFIFQKNCTNLEIRLTLEKNKQEHYLEVFLEKKDKVYANFRIDGVKKKKKDAQGFFRVVVFDPTDVDMFSKSPEFRRKYLNMVLAQKNPEYLEILSEYKKAIFQKSKLLTDFSGQNFSNTGLDEWNEQVVLFGSQIIMERKKFINYLNNGVADIYTTISGFHRPIEVEYETITGENISEISQNFSYRLQDVLNKEKLSGQCLVGPHRDDFSLKSEGLFLPPFSSRGELRGQVMALKILELEYLSNGEDKPILLLDDVLSELDDSRRTFLLKFLQDKFQVFITTTHPLEIPAQHITLSLASEDSVQENIYEKK